MRRLGFSELMTSLRRRCNTRLSASASAPLRVSGVTQQVLRLIRLAANSVGLVYTIDSPTGVTADANNFKKSFEEACEINAATESAPAEPEEEAPKTEVCASWAHFQRC